MSENKIGTVRSVSYDRDHRCIMATITLNRKLDLSSIPCKVNGIKVILKEDANRDDPIIGKFVTELINKPVFLGERDG